MYGLEENAVRYVLVHGNDVITFFAVWISKTLVRVMRFRRKGRFQSFLDRNRSENLQQFQFKRTTKGSDAGKEETWRDGRRVIELGFLIDRLKECEKCKQALCLSNIVSEKQFGLASILHIAVILFFRITPGIKPRSDILLCTGNQGPNEFLAPTFRPRSYANYNTIC